MDIRELAGRYARAWAARDLDAMMALHTDDTVFVLHADDGKPAIGSAAVREAFSAVLAQSPDLQFAPKRVQFGELHFISEYTMSGTRHGKPFACDGVDIFVVKDGLVSRKDSYPDWILYARQVDLPLAVPHAP